MTKLNLYYRLRCHGVASVSFLFLILSCCTFRSSQAFVGVNHVAVTSRSTERSFSSPKSSFATAAATTTTTTTSLHLLLHHHATATAAATWLTTTTPPLHELQALLRDSFQTTLASFQHSFPLVTSLWETYVHSLHDKPLQTKTLTAATLCFTGDVVAQFQASEPRYNLQRGLAFLLFGAMYTGCFQHGWFEYLNAHVIDWGEDWGVWGHAAVTNIPVSSYIQNEEWWHYFDLVAGIEEVMATLQDPPSLLEIAAAKVAINQFAVIPFVYMPLFFAISGAVAGMDVRSSWARMQSLYFPILQRNYLFWIPMQFVQFYALPTEYQVPFVCLASLCWTIILSSIGGSTTTASSSTLETPIVYETTAMPAEATQEQLVTVLPVESGTVNELTDQVRLEDVQEALVPSSLRHAVEQVETVVEDAWSLSSPRARSGASGMILGLLAAAADDAALGAQVTQTLMLLLLGGGGAVGDDMMSDHPATFGVALVTTLSTVVGCLLGKNKKEEGGHQVQPPAVAAVESSPQEQQTTTGTTVVTLVEDEFQPLLLVVEAENELPPLVAVETVGMTTSTPVAHNSTVSFS